MADSLAPAVGMVARSRHRFAHTPLLRWLLACALLLAPLAGYVPQAHAGIFPFSVEDVVLIARALAQEPVLLVMDEPTASLDFGNQIRVLETIAQLRQQGMAVLLSTHLLAIGGQLARISFTVRGDALVTSSLHHAAPADIGVQVAPA